MMIKIPKLRFPEFSGEWEEKKMGDVVWRIKTGVSVNSEERLKLTSELGILKTSAVFKRKFKPYEHKTILLSENKRAKINPKKGTVIVSRMNTPGLVGESAYVYEDHDDLYLPDRLWLVEFNKYSNGEFISFLISEGKIRSKLSTIATGTSNSMKNISQPGFLAIRISLPNSDEQQKIALFLTSVDSWIESLKKQQEELEKYKKGMMQKIFSQKIRYKDDNGKNFPKWEENKLGDLFDECNDRKENQSFEMLSISQSKGIVKQDTTIKKDSSSLDKSKYKIVRVGDIAYNTMRMWQGASAVSSFDGIVSPAYTVVRPKKGNVIFFGYLFKYPRIVFNFYRYSQGLTSDTWNLKFKHFSEIIVTIPASTKEQEKIANFLTSIDNLLQSKQQQISMAENWKKGLMQRMFV
ncbi:MAG TPA: restriction endonuclease subunit S [Patescibacteria group bacterium]|nr:restriction endonuclease subunit S [Patescibacteria group bacterium]